MKTLQLLINSLVTPSSSSSSPPFIVSKRPNFNYVSLTNNNNLQINHSSRLVLRRRCLVPPLAAAAAFNYQEGKPRDPKLVSAGKKEKKLLLEGVITESLPNGMFRVRLENGEEILGYISGRIRKNFIRILPGDRVKMEVSRYDTTKGRIIYRN